MSEQIKISKKKIETLHKLDCSYNICDICRGTGFIAPISHKNKRGCQWMCVCCLKDRIAWDYNDGWEEITIGSVSVDIDKLRIKEKNGS